MAGSGNKADTVKQKFYGTYAHPRRKNRTNAEAKSKPAKHPF
jgi:hypothetical protein